VAEGKEEARHARGREYTRKGRGEELRKEELENTKINE